MQISLLVRAAVLFPLLFFSAWSDMKSGIIPNRYVLCGLLSAVPAAVLFPVAAEKGPLLYGAALLLLLCLLRHLHLIGGGDIKLFLVIFCFFPCRTGLLIVCGSFFFAAAAGICGFLRNRTRRIPMGAGILLSAFSILAFPGGVL